MAQEFLTLNLFAFFLIFIRIGAAFLVLPGFAAVYINVRTRLLFALAISFVLSPTLIADLPARPATGMGLAMLVLGESVIGVFIGMVARILVGALQVAGTLMSYFSSMANAMVRDPITQQQSSVIAGFLSVMGIFFIFVTDTHHLMIRGLTDSYVLFVPGQPIPLDDFAWLIARRVSDSFALGLQLASPMALVALTYYIGIGLLGRLMPAMPVFFVGLPIQLATQITVLMLILSSVMIVFLSKFQEGMGFLIAP